MRANGRYGRDGSLTHAASALEAPAFRRPSFPFLRNVYRPPEWNRTTINRESSGRSATELRVRASCQSRTDDLPLTRRPLWPTELRRHTDSSQNDCSSHSQGGVSDLTTGHCSGQSGSATRLHCRPSTSSRPDNGSGRLRRRQGDYWESNPDTRHHKPLP